uniref:Uncharacterized protein n=1 Tax=Corethron hystrix TaxID=216773 RepID=A0A7S1FXV7_9STRA|mmetsp:Transcript_37834/g.88074  ORF Transcript_37834/g.88074 Transcript_37834/m.88074 type:complete len:162 (+) Transcript_37834:82-567(+)
MGVISVAAVSVLGCMIGIAIGTAIVDRCPDDRSRNQTAKLVRAISHAVAWVFFFGITYSLGVILLCSDSTSCSGTAFGRHLHEYGIVYSGASGLGLSLITSVMVMSAGPTNMSDDEISLETGITEISEDDVPDEVALTKNSPVDEVVVTDGTSPGDVRSLG